MLGLIAGAVGGGLLKGLLQKAENDKMEARNRGLREIGAARARWSPITRDNTWSGLLQEASKPLPSKTSAFLSGLTDGAMLGRSYTGAGGLTGFLDDLQARRDKAESGE